MMEMKITVEASDLAASIAKLAEAVASLPNPNLLTPDEPRPVASYSSTPDPVSAPPVSPIPAATPTPTVAPDNAPAPSVPVTTAQTYTLDQISRAGASLVDAGKMEQLLGLLGRYGVQAVTQLQPEQYGAFATELRALGAQI